MHLTTYKMPYFAIDLLVFFLYFYRIETNCVNFFFSKRSNRKLWRVSVERVWIVANINFSNVGSLFVLNSQMFRDREKKNNKIKWFLFCIFFLIHLWDAKGTQSPTTNTQIVQIGNKKNDGKIIASIFMSNE